MDHPSLEGDMATALLWSGTGGGETISSGYSLHFKMALVQGQPSGFGLRSVQPHLAKHGREPNADSDLDLQVKLARI